jgi:hypothetical protein
VEIPAYRPPCPGRERITRKASYRSVSRQIVNLIEGNAATGIPQYRDAFGDPTTSYSSVPMAVAVESKPAPDVSVPTPLEPPIAIGNAPTLPAEREVPNRPLPLDPAEYQSPVVEPPQGGTYVALAPSRSTTTRTDAHWIQTRLWQLGFLRVKPNGLWDDASRDALRDFKVLNQLPHNDGLGCGN